jgi:hypothetical protein
VINGWYMPWVILDKRMVHSLGWEGQEKDRVGGKIRIVVGEYQLSYKFYELRVDSERPPSFVDY